MARPAMRRIAVPLLIAALLAPLVPLGPAGPPPVRAQGIPAPFVELPFQSQDTGSPRSAAWGDVDADGDLDLALGLEGGSDIPVVRLYKTEGGQLSAVKSWETARRVTAMSLAWADVDNDGLLDLAVGASDTPIQIYRNVGGALPTTPTWELGATVNVVSLDWGDYNRDGLPDLLVGVGGGRNQVYRNVGGQLAAPPAWEASAAASNAGAAWADFDRDGWLDFAALTNSPGDLASRLYRNSGAGAFAPAQLLPVNAGADKLSLAWGDYNNDGYPDLAVGYFGSNTQIIVNTRGDLGTSLLPEPGLGLNAAYGLAWGDYDGDGNLDLAAAHFDTTSGMRPSRLHRNLGNGSFATSFIQRPAARPIDIAWADYDNDGDLDFSLVNQSATDDIILFNNTSEPLGRTPLAPITAPGLTVDLAWGDVDGDGSLDLAVANSDTRAPGQPAPSRIFRSQGGTLVPGQILSQSERLVGVAWGDADGDGDADLAAVEAGTGLVRLYRNSGGSLASDWASADGGAVAVAWGDVDNDGDLDLAAAAPSPRLYRNGGGQLESAPAWTAPAGAPAVSAAWGDLDADGDLDLAVGTERGPALFRNDGGLLGAAPLWSVDAGQIAYGLAWGDMNGDGSPDLAVGYGRSQGFTVSNPARVYLNSGTALGADPAWLAQAADSLRQIAWGDYDGDGDLDLAAARLNAPPVIFRNQAGQLGIAVAWNGQDASAGNSSGSAVAWGDYDGDGDLDLAAANSAGLLALYPSRFSGNRQLSSAPIVRVRAPAGTPALGAGYGAARIYQGSQLAIPLTLTNRFSLPAPRVEVQYSLDGGGNWRRATPAPGVPTTNLASSPGGVAHTFVWNTQADAVMGLSHDVRVRVLLPAGTVVPGADLPRILYGTYSAVSPPFRLRGGQPRVLDQAGAPVQAAVVYRLAPDLDGAGPLLVNPRTGAPWATDITGYLQGRSPIAAGDRLVALKQIGRRGKARFFQTSAAPTPQDLAVPPVAATGVQTLTVSPANPLMLLDLDVSLEWDARADTAFMNRLRADLRRASRSLYDWSDGQAALGAVTIYQNKERWHDSFDGQGRLAVRGADIRIYASNRLRPSASQGGIVDANTPDLDRPEQTYERGEVRVGAIWNRDGGFTPIDGSLDWAQALAHELGHYALFLDDNYLGLQDGRLVTVRGCRGAMADPYEVGDSEFHPDAGWLPACAATLSNRATGRSDWATILRYYSGAVPGFTLAPPAAYDANPGPAGLTMAVTTFVEPPPAQAGDAPRDLRVLQAGGSTYVPGPGVRAFALGPGDATLLDLGRPTADGRLLARGPRDRVCVVDLDRADPHLGCAARADANVQMAPRAGWQPDIRLTAVTSRTVMVAVPADSVGQPAPAKLVARLFPTDSALAPITQELALSGGAYTGTIASGEAVTEGYLLVSVPGDSAPARVAVTDYALGGSPAPQRRPKTRNKRRAPLVSSDGGAVIFSQGVSFGANQFFSLQTATRLPPDPPVAIPVAQGYRLVGDDAAIGLLQSSGASLNLSYAAADLGDLDPATATVYFYPEGGGAWQRLPTARDPESSEVSAVLAGRGLYAVMASALWDLSLPGLRLNQRYPGATAPMPDALTPLTGGYVYVYGRDAADAADPWKVYAPGAPAWVNDLERLESGQRYHILAVGDLMAPYKPVGAEAPDLAPAQALPDPPALVYGVLAPRPGVTPAAGVVVRARFGEQVCAETTTRLVDGKVVFAFDVPSEDEVRGCGRLGRSFTLTIGDYAWPLPLGWNNETIYDLAGRKLYLPLLRK